MGHVSVVLFLCFRFEKCHLELESIVPVQHLADCDQGWSPKGFFSIGFDADEINSRLFGF